MTDYFPEAISLPTGVEMLLEHEEHRSECPNCHQQTLLRPKTLTKAILRPLWLASMKATISSKEVNDAIGRTAYANFTQLKYWGFIRPSSSSTWEITTAGRDFLTGRLYVPEKVWVYNDRVRVVPDGMKGRMVAFDDLVAYLETGRAGIAAESAMLTVE